MANSEPMGSGDERLTKEQPKKPYNKPAYRFECVFETQALSCGKITSQGPCHLNRKTS